MHFHQVIDAWARSQHQRAGQYADTILARLEERATSDAQFTPNRVVLNSVMHAHSRQGHLDPAEQIFQRMKADPNIGVQIGEYNAMLSAFAKKGEGRRAEELLKEMLDEDTFVQPDIISYNCILDAWQNGNEPGDADRAASILKTLQEKYDSGESWIKPNARSYATVAAAFRGREDATEMAHHYLFTATERGVAGDMYNYNIMLDAWACSGDPMAAEFAEEILLYKMEPDGLVNSVSYNTVIKAWKNSDRPDAAQRADSILKRMMAITKKGNRYAVTPDTWTFTGVIDCYAKSKQSGLAGKALEVFEDMVRACKEGNIAAKPNTVTLNCVLDALAKSGEAGAADQAKTLLLRVLNSNEPCLDKAYPDAISYTSLIDAFGRTGTAEGAREAKAIFKMMEAQFAEGDVSCKPTMRTYNTIMNSLVQNEKNGYEEETEAILDRMEALYESGDLDLRPNVISYSIVMNGWSKSKHPDALQRTEAVFSRLVRSYKAGNNSAKPNLFIFVSLLNAVCKSGSPRAPQRAENIVRHMYREYLAGSGDLKPNAQAITQAIGCWAKSGDTQSGEKAEELFNWLVEIYEKDQDRSLRPNAMTFNAIITAWAKSRVADKARRARNCLNRMVEMYEAGNPDAKPNTIIYTAVLNACGVHPSATEDEKVTAFQIANATYTELRASGFGRPNHVTYGSYLLACKNLPDDEDRTLLVKRTFKECCADGQLDEFVFSKVRRYLPREDLLQIFHEMGFVPDGDSAVYITNLPDKWQCHVKGRSKSKRANKMQSEKRRQ